MCDSKYHEEACRKARVIERRAEAQQRMMGKPDQVQTTSGPMPGVAAQSGGAGGQQLSWGQVERHLRREAKELRNHNLFMGNIDCFKDLYNRGQLDPHVSTTHPHH